MQAVGCRRCDAGGAKSFSSCTESRVCICLFVNSLHSLAQRAPLFVLQQKGAHTLSSERCARAIYLMWWRCVHLHPSLIIEIRTKCKRQQIDFGLSHMGTAQLPNINRAVREQTKQNKHATARHPKFIFCCF